LAVAPVSQVAVGSAVAARAAAERAEAGKERGFMATLIDRSFSAMDMDAIEAAVTKAEKLTTGEIAVDLASRSKNWQLERYIHAAVTMIAAGLAALWLTRESDWGVYYNLSQSLMYGIGGFLLAYFGWERVLRRKSRRQKVVWKRAVRQFHQLTPVRGMAGVLIFVSLEENEAALVADQGIAEKVKPEYWGKARLALIEAMKKGAYAEGIIASIDSIAALLAEHFPGGADDENLLSNRPERLD